MVGSLIGLARMGRLARVTRLARMTGLTRMTRLARVTRLTRVVVLARVTMLVTRDSHHDVDSCAQLLGGHVMGAAVGVRPVGDFLDG